MAEYWLYVDPFTTTYHEGSLLIAAVMSGLILYPALFWLWNGWAWKENDILVSLSLAAKNEYLKAFQRQEDNNATASERFSLFYMKWYGRRHYLVPTGVLFIIVFYHAVSLAETAQFYMFASATEHSSVYVPIPTVSAAAFVGAYTFVAWDFTTRAARRDITSDDIVLGALRLVVCVPMGHAFGTLLQATLQPFVAFAIGVFPVATLATILRRLLSKQLNLDIAPDTRLDQVIKLSGVDSHTADRIAETDITTIAQLAYCDPIQLAMRSNLSFSYVLDIVSQALAWVYLEDKLDALRTFGLRGAFEIWTFREEIQSADETVRARAEAVAPLAAAAVALHPIALQNAFDEVASDPRTKFLVSVYN